MLYTFHCTTGGQKQLLWAHSHEDCHHTISCSTTRFTAPQVVKNNFFGHVLMKIVIIRATVDTLDDATAWLLWCFVVALFKCIEAVYRTRIADVARAGGDNVRHRRLTKDVQIYLIVNICSALFSTWLCGAHDGWWMLRWNYDSICLTILASNTLRQLMLHVDTTIDDEQRESVEYTWGIGSGLAVAVMSLFYHAHIMYFTGFSMLVANVCISFKVRVAWMSMTRLIIAIDARNQAKQTLDNQLRALLTEATPASLLCA